MKKPTAIVMCVILLQLNGCMTLLIGQPTKAKADGVARRGIQAVYKGDEQALIELGLSADQAHAAVAHANGRLGTADAEFRFDYLTEWGYYRQYGVRRVAPGPVDLSDFLGVRICSAHLAPPTIKYFQYMGAD